MKRYLVFVALLASAGIAQAELYRSIDKDGKVIYSDKPLQGAEDVAEIRANKAPSDLGLPFETQQAMQYFPVTLYVFEKCGATCEQARALLEKRGIPYTEKNLKTEEEFAEYQKATGSGDLPSLMVGRTRLKGYAAEQWQRELDFAGYPKSAPQAAAPAAQ